MKVRVAVLEGSKLLKSPSADMKKAIADADDIVISIGGNDMIHYAANTLLTVCANNGLLVNGYTAADVPAEPTFDQIFTMLDKNALKAFAEDLKNQTMLNHEVQKLRADLATKSTDENARKFKCLIDKQIIGDSNGTGIVAAVTEIKNINPDAEIIVQSVYNPTQFEPSYYEAAYTGTTKKFMDLLRPVFKSVTESFRDQLSNVEGVKIADIYEDFSSIDPDDSSVQYSWYFTNVQASRAEMDFHPNQAGHVAIASKVIDTIGTKKQSGDLIVKTFDSLPNKANYPAAALDTYKRVTADTIKPSETTTTTTTTTTTKPTTTTTTTKAT